MINDIFRQKIFSMIRQVKDDLLREHLEQTLKLYIRTRSIIEKKVYRDRIITFYSEWLKKQHIDPHKRKMTLHQLKRLLLALKK